MTEKVPVPEQTEQAKKPSILVVASDPKLRKLLDMALSLELGCPVHMVDNARKADEVVTRLTPALMIVDEQLLTENAHDLSARLHRIAGLEQLPTLFLNVPDLSQDGHQGYPIRFLEPSWKVVDLYAAVQALLGQTPSRTS